MARGIVIIIWSFGVLVWPQVGLGQGTIYTRVDSKGIVHYSDTPTGVARSIHDELPPAAILRRTRIPRRNRKHRSRLFRPKGRPLSVTRYSTKGKERPKAVKSGETGPSARTVARRLGTSVR